METDRIKQMNIAFIGAGNMAEALINGIIGGGLLPPEKVSAADPLEERRSHFSKQFGITVYSDNTAAVAGADCVILAVKPQIVNGLLEEISASLSPDCLVVSIAAGVPTDTLESLLPAGQRIIRAMPNTPALIGMGVAALSAGSNATNDDLESAEIMLGALGKTLRVDETDMDAVTAVSGSGPAYVFFLIENMIAAGIEMGLDAETARELTSATVEGSVRLMIESGCEAHELRKRVTSKGGTTAAAIEHLEKRETGKTIMDALKAARARSRELAQQ